jgi:hypothetical protein
MYTNGDLIKETCSMKIQGQITTTKYHKEPTKSTQFKKNNFATLKSAPNKSKFANPRYNCSEHLSSSSHSSELDPTPKSQLGTSKIFFESTQQTKNQKIHSKRVSKTKKNLQEAAKSDFPANLPTAIPETKFPPIKREPSPEKQNLKGERLETLNLLKKMENSGEASTMGLEIASMIKKLGAGSDFKSEISDES